MKGKEGELILNRRSPLTNNYFEVTLWRIDFLIFASCLWKSVFLRLIFMIISGWFNFWNMFTYSRHKMFAYIYFRYKKTFFQDLKTYCMLINLQCYKKNWNRNIYLVFVFPVHSNKKYSDTAISSIKIRVKRFSVSKPRFG